MTRRSACRSGRPTTTRRTGFPSNDATGRRASFSNFGTDVALSAPGVNILSTSNSGTTVPVADGYGLADGTSLAAPQVSGVAALMLAVNGNLTPAQS